MTTARSDIPEDAAISRSPQQISTTLDGESVILETSSGAYYTLTEVGHAVWQALEAPLPFRDLVARLEGEYAVDPSTCRRETAAFLREMAAAGLVTIG